jgi:hypothetical protein
MGKLPKEEFFSAVVQVLSCSGTVEERMDVGG